MNETLAGLPWRRAPTPSSATTSGFAAASLSPCQKSPAPFIAHSLPSHSGAALTLTRAPLPPRMQALRLAGRQVGVSVDCYDS
jgi:hypothetical protein